MNVNLVSIIELSSLESKENFHSEIFSITHGTYASVRTWSAATFLFQSITILRIERDLEYFIKYDGSFQFLEASILIS